MQKRRCIELDVICVFRPTSRAASTKHERRSFCAQCIASSNFPFSRITCCSTVAPSMARSANSAAALLHHRWRATLFHPKATLRSSSRRVFSHRNASVSNKCKPCCSSVVASLLQMLLLNLHVRFVVIVLLFKFLHNADESLKDMDPLASRPANCRTRDQDDAGMCPPICM